MLSLVGNHDIGYGAEVQDWAVRRFEKSFGGKTNNAAVIGGHVLAAFDTMSLEGSPRAVRVNAIHNHCGSVLRQTPCALALMRPAATAVQCHV